MKSHRQTALCALMIVVAQSAVAQSAAPQPAPAASLDLVGPISDYKLYVTENVDKLVADTTAFADAIKADDLDRAKALYAGSRVGYERIEPIAELFSDLDVSMDARADDFEAAEKDPGFTGFHRIEYALWEQGSTQAAHDTADRLLTDVKDLQGRIDALTFPPRVVVAGAAVLMEEVAATKISGEEDRYSHTDLWDIRANVDGSRKIYDLVRPLLTDTAFTARVEANFATVDSILDKYREGDGFAHYDTLTADDRNLLAAAVNTLAEDLSKLPGSLGLA